jgi:DNA-directed RNA polymerase subunit beta'
MYETTPGRMMIGELLPKHANVPFDICNKLMTKKEISRHDRYRVPAYGPEGDGDLLRPDHAAGLHPGGKAGISFGKDDMVIPETKARLVRDTRARQRIRAAVQ